MSDKFNNEGNGDKANFLKRLLKVGTVECAVFFGILALIIAILFILIGFWKTLLIVAMICVGLFIGGVADKKGLFKGIADKIIPKKQTKLYHREDYSTGHSADDGWKRDAEPAETDDGTED